MIVLGMAGSVAPKALDLYAAQLMKDDQALWVKVWACRGYTAASNHGASNIEASRAINATEAVGWLPRIGPQAPLASQGARPGSPGLDPIGDRQQGRSED